MRSKSVLAPDRCGGRCAWFPGDDAYGGRGRDAGSPAGEGPSSGASRGHAASSAPTAGEGWQAPTDGGRHGLIGPAGGSRTVGLRQRGFVNDDGTAAATVQRKRRRRAGDGDRDPAAQ